MHVYVNRMFGDIQAVAYRFSRTWWSLSAHR